MISIVAKNNIHSLKLVVDLLKDDNFYNICNYCPMMFRMFLPKNLKNVKISYDLDPDLDHNES